VFFRWAGERHSELSEITVGGIDDFLEQKRRSGLKPRSLAAYCHALRTFFHYSASQGWTEPAIARAIKSPPVVTFGETPNGPSWKDVRRMLVAETGRTPAALRCKAVLFLCAIYALRGIEIRSLKVTDFDWVNERFVVRRAKRGPIQQFPIQYETGEAILSYLRYGRPRCSAAHLFVTLKPPYRQIDQGTLASLVKSRIKELDTETIRHGTHALRHSCATELLRRGSSLIEIADFLGHRNIQSVSTYAKLDRRSLRRVAVFGFAGLR
jgi:site-specific recombinase XerD